MDPYLFVAVCLAAVKSGNELPGDRLVLCPLFSFDPASVFWGQCEPQRILKGCHFLSEPSCIFSYVSSFVRNFFSYFTTANHFFSLLRNSSYNQDPFSALGK